MWVDLSTVVMGPCFIKRTHDYNLVLRKTQQKEWMGYYEHLPQGIRNHWILPFYSQHLNDCKTELLHFGEEMHAYIKKWEAGKLKKVHVMAKWKNIGEKGTKNSYVLDMKYVQLSLLRVDVNHLYDGWVGHVEVKKTPYNNQYIYLLPRKNQKMTCKECADELLMFGKAVNDYLKGMRERQAEREKGHRK